MSHHTVGQEPIHVAVELPQIDLMKRDPNNMNEHVKVRRSAICFIDYIATRSQGSIWRCVCGTRPNSF